MHLWVSFISPKHASDRSSGKRSRVLPDAHAAAIFGSLARLPERDGRSLRLEAARCGVVYWPSLVGVREYTTPLFAVLSQPLDLTCESIAHPSLISASDKAVGGLRAKVSLSLARLGLSRKRLVIACRRISRPTEPLPLLPPSPAYMHNYTPQLFGCKVADSIVNTT